MTGVSLLGPLPGDAALSMTQKVLDALTDVPTGVEGIPAVVQLPDRGPHATSVARTAALLTEMPVELGTHGWKLADRPGRDLERIHSLQRQDLDELAIAAHGWSGPLVLTVRGPLTMAAILWLARGDRVLSDHGAVRDVALGLGDGVAELLARFRVALPAAQPVVVLREPMLQDALAGTVPTFSGHGRIPALGAEVAGDRLRVVVEALREAGARQVVVHGGSRFASRAFRVLGGVGADAVGVAGAALSEGQWEQVAEAVEAGTGMWFGLPGEKFGQRAKEPRKLAARIAKPWTAVGLPAKGLRDVVVHVETSTHASGDLVLADRRLVRPALRVAVEVATVLAERAEDG